MKWWPRGRRKAAKSPAAAENVLVISDIHLGEDILVEGPGHLAEYIRALNRELTDFIAFHRVSAAGRWHLVINGDMFDFVKVSVLPEEGEPGPTAQQGGGGVPNTEENVAWKLGRILEIHRPLFRELARFLAADHRVTIVEGNHDAEFYFPKVQQTLRDEVVRLAIQEARGDAKAREAAPGVAQRLAFRSWFEASPGRFHIEHGHQYDEFCSFAYNLAPLDGDASTLATPLSHRPMPYFADLLGDFSTHGVARWGFLDMLKLMVRLGPKAVWTLGKLYLVVGFTLLRLAGPKRRRELEVVAERHTQKLRALSQVCCYGYTTLQALDALKAPPAEYSLLKMAHIFYLDRFLVLGATAVGMALGAWGWQVAGLATALGVGLVALLALAGWRRLDVRDVLRQAAAGIANATGARYVVFGHSHDPEMINLRDSFGAGTYGPSSYYVNSGSWVTREILRGEAGMGMTYVEIGEQGAALKRWRGAGQPPQVLADSGATEQDTAQGNG